MMSIFVIVILLSGPGIAFSQTMVPTLRPTVQPTPKTSEIPGRFCATFNPDTASGAVGFFAVDIQNNTGKVWFKLDVTNFTSSTCDFSKGLNYHIHTSWSYPALTTSSASCAGSSLHYDPTLACGPASAEKNGLCVAAGYSSSAYTCSPSVYHSGQYLACELGDLSGKFGRSMPGGANSKLFHTDPNDDPLLDYTPPYVLNYAASAGYVKAWSSVVFHCASTSQPILCAKLVKATEASQCAQMPHKPYYFDPEYLTHDQRNMISNNDNTAIAIIVIGVGVVAIIYAIIYLQYQADKAREAKEAALREAGGVVTGTETAAAAPEH